MKTEKNVTPGQSSILLGKPFTQNLRYDFSDEELLKKGELLAIKSRR